MAAKIAPTPKPAAGRQAVCAAARGRFCSAKGKAGKRLFALQEENEFVVVLRVQQEFIAGLLGESLEIAH